MIAYLKELYRFRELLWRWTLREIGIRYKQSVLGVVWAILQPLAMMAMFTLVFSLLVQMPADDLPYPLFSYTALLPWTFFQTSVSFGVPSLVNNLNLVTKTYFPREILPLGAIGAAFFDFLIASTIFLFMFLFYRVPLSWTAAWVPLLLALQVLLTAGVTLLGAAIIVLYRDVRFVVPLGLQLWLYATPVIYPVSLVPEPLRPYYLLNPMAGIIDSYRRVILYGQSPIWEQLGPSVVVVLALFLFGYQVFKRLEVSFADII
jgi:lipopolysaccharide transport system permease protein